MNNFFFKKYFHFSSFIVKWRRLNRTNVYELVTPFFPLYTWETHLWVQVSELKSSELNACTFFIMDIVCLIWPQMMINCFLGREGESMRKIFCPEDSTWWNTAITNFIPFWIAQILLKFHEFFFPVSYTGTCNYRISQHLKKRNWGEERT